MGDRAGVRRGRLGLLLLVLLALTVGAVYRSTLLRFAGADGIALTGARRLTAARVMEAAALTPGAPRWEHPAAGIAARLEAEPWIRKAQVEWDWNQLRVHLEEREAVGLLPYQGRWVAMDETARILELVESPAVMRLPVISGVATGTALRGQVLAHPGLQDALLLLSYTALSSSLRTQVAEVHIAPDGWLLLYMTGGAVVEWGPVQDGKGRGDRLAAKVDLLGAFLKDVPRNRMPSCRIDMRVEGKVIPSGCL